MRWLDALGWAKWPSLLLILSPIAAYPFWLPAPEPARDCGRVKVNGQTFRVFRSGEGGEFALRPVFGGRTGPVVQTSEPTGFSAGGMTFSGQDPALAGLSCAPTA